MLKQCDILNKFNHLPFPLRQEVLDFVDYLIYKSKLSASSTNCKTKKLNFEWEDTLEKLKSKYTSIQLQKESLKWR